MLLKDEKIKRMMKDAKVFVEYRKVVIIEKQHGGGMKK